MAKPKTITDPQIIGRLGEEIVSARAHTMGFVFSHHGPLEAGIDGFLEIRDPAKGRVTGQFIAVQVKTTADRAYAAETERGFEYTMRSDDVAYWRGTNVPVIVVLVRLSDGTAYWKSVDAGGEGRRLHIDKTRDAFDETAGDAIAALCVHREGFGVYFPPLNHGETAHLNLLKVCFPAKIYVAFSPYKTGRQAMSVLLESEERPPDDWVVRGGQFMAFRDPSSGPLINVVDAGTVEQIDSDELAFPEELPDEYAFIDLLRRTVAAQLEGTLSFDRQRRTFYFPALPPEIERTYYYESLKRNTAAKVVKAYRRDDVLKYVRHHAFEPRFWRVANEWFMSVTPTFHFTWDGFRPDKFAGSRLTGKKQREFNSALSGQLAMWRHVLVDHTDDQHDLLRPESSPERTVTFEALRPLEMERAVPETIWREGDPQLVDLGLFEDQA